MRGRERAGQKAPQKKHHFLLETKEHLSMPAVLLVLLLVILLFGVGAFAAVKLLLWIAIILAIIWLIGFFVRGSEGARWYRW